MDTPTKQPARSKRSGFGNGVPSFSARVNEKYLSLGIAGQAQIYEDHGGGTETKRPTTNPLTGEREDNPSFSLFQFGDRLRWKNHKTDEHGDLFDYLKHLYGDDGARRILGIDGTGTTRYSAPPATPVAQPTPVAPNRDKQVEALTYWNEAETADLSPAVAYLAGRGITISLPGSIRYHASKKMMVGKVTSKAAEFLGIHRTFKMFDHENRKKMLLGPCSGGAVRLAEPTNGKLGISEGIENGLVAQQTTDLAVWSCMSWTLLAAVQLPDTIREVWIFADSDPWNAKESLSMLGQKAAQKAAQRLTGEGCTVHIVYPCEQTDRPQKMDFNDLLKADPTGANIRERVSLAEIFISHAKEKPIDDDDEGLEEFLRRSQEDAEEANNGRKTMKLAGGGLHWITEKSQRLLFEHSPESLFERTGGILVRLVRSNEKTKKTGVSRPKNSLSIVRVTEPWLQATLTSIIQYLKFDKRSGQWFPVDAPPLVTKVILDNEGNRPFHHLAGIITAPTMRADGTILDQPGYDIDTGLMFEPSSETFPTIPTNPTRDQALAALATLIDVISGFPFVSDADRSVALAAILTALVRSTLRTSPLFAITAPKMASGKSLVADTVGMVATGRPPTTMSHETDPAAEAKRVLSILLNGDQVACIDNISAPLHSDILCTILTQETWTERLLGVNKTAEVSTCCVWLATGNNLVFRGDLSTRVLLCSLDPRVEKPEEREFDRNLHEWVPENRGALVAAGLTVLRAFHVAGRPRSKDMKQFGRFEQWSDLIRASLIWLDQADPCKTREKIESSDPVREGLRSLLSAWHDAVGSELKTLAAVIHHAKSEADKVTEFLDVNDPTWEKVSQLQESLKVVAGEDGGGINTRKLGHYLLKHENRIENNLFFKKGTVKDRAGVAMWSVKSAGLLGSAGFCQPTPCESG